MKKTKTTVFWLCCINPFLNTEHTESTEQKEGKLQGDRMTTLVILLFALHLGVLGAHGVYCPNYATTLLLW